LSDPIDVYSDWVDASEHVRPEVIGGGRSPDFDDYDDLEE
ncbi:7831_t:CDS:2, partial [Gigaspora rosea]